MRISTDCVMTETGHYSSIMVHIWVGIIDLQIKKDSGFQKIKAKDP